MKQHSISRKWKMQIVLLILVALAGLWFGGCFSGKTEAVVEAGSEKENGNTADEPEEKDNNETGGAPEEGSDVTALLYGVHVTGAVKDPDHVWLLPEGSRVEDAILAAGGALDEADLSVLNLASYISDGDRIYVPTEEETQNGTYAAGSSMQNEGNEMENENALHLTNLNSATKIELMELPGIGESIAQRIIDYRLESGGFDSIEEIMNVTGIGESKFEQIKDLITVDKDRS